MTENNDIQNSKASPGDGSQAPAGAAPAAPAEWVTPSVTKLPPLSDLTLQSIPGGGDTGGGGSTVLP